MVAVSADKSDAAFFGKALQYDMSLRDRMISVNRFRKFTINIPEQIEFPHGQILSVSIKKRNLD